MELDNEQYILVKKRVNEKMAILGCGWLGLPLAKYFTSKGYIVKGSTTSIEKIEILKSFSIEPL